MGPRNQRHQALFRRLLPLGFEPQVLIRTGKGGIKRLGAAWWIISAYHPGKGIGVQILFPEDRATSRKLEFLEQHCAYLFTIPSGMEFYAALDGVEKRVRELLNDVSG